MTNKIWDIRKQVENKKPIIHCITNPISINQCANLILSLGAKPIMAEHPKEVADITKASDSLMLNIGNITEVRMKSIFLSMKTAIEKEIPVLLDVVGSACSDLRRKYVFQLLNFNAPTVIKGNYSEIKALYDSEYFSPGVDADISISLADILIVAKKLSQKYKTVILATGKEDVITDGKRTFCVKNGIKQLTYVTGTGCMSGALTTTFMAMSNPLDAAVAACCYFGICSELSKTDAGMGSFMVNLMDKISTIDKEDLLKYLNLEEK